MDNALSITAIVALIVNLLSVIHYGTRLRHDIVEQVKADEKRWADHEKRLALLEQALINSQQNLKHVISSMDERLKQMNEAFFNLATNIIEERTGRPDRP